MGISIDGVERFDREQLIVFIKALHAKCDGYERSFPEMEKRLEKKNKEIDRLHKILSEKLLQIEKLRAQVMWGDREKSS